MVFILHRRVETLVDNLPVLVCESREFLFVLAIYIALLYVALSCYVLDEKIVLRLTFWDLANDASSF